jgi:putative N6-adenine-specific DNA methylase
LHKTVSMQLVAKTLFGLEEVLVNELKNLGAEKIKAGNRVVTFEGDKELMYRANLYLRTAIAVLTPIAEFRFKDEKDLYQRFSKIDFSQYLTIEKTFAVKGAVHSKLFNYTQFPMLVLKDAIADFFRDRFNKRPSVDTERPNVVFDVYIQEHECIVSLNSSGAPLFQRGYRRSTGEAPLNEVVAAGLLFLSGWDKNSNLVDVFCGSGTLPIEAALMANDIPPNIARKAYAFQHWADYDDALWQKIYDEAPKTPKRNLNFKIIGSDTDGDVILKARENIKALPLGKTIEFEVKDFADFVPPEGGGVLISNPPYGERLADYDIGDLYQQIGNYFKHTMQGYTCWILSSNFEALKRIELKPNKKIQLYNGSLDCDFRKFEIFKGSLVEHKYGAPMQRREPKRNKKKEDNES